MKTKTAPVVVAAIALLLAAAPALAGAPEAPTPAAAEAALTDGDACALSLARVSREARVGRDRVTLVFRSSDRDALAAIIKLAGEGRLFGTDEDGRPLYPRRLRRSPGVVEVDALAPDVDGLSRAALVAVRVAGDKPACGAFPAVARLPGAER